MKSSSEGEALLDCDDNAKAFDNVMLADTTSLPWAIASNPRSNLTLTLERAGKPNVTKGNPRISVRLDPISRSRIKAVSADLGLTVSEFVRNTIYLYFNQ